MLLVVITEYHLSSSVHPAEVLSPVIPPSVREWLGPLKYYVGMGDDGIESLDLRPHERAHTLHLAVWLHRMGMRHYMSSLAEYSLDPQHHHQGDLLRFFLALGNSPVTFEQVIKENREEAEQEHDEANRSLRATRDAQRTAKALFKEVHEAYKELT